MLAVCSSWLRQDPPPNGLQGNLWIAGAGFITASMLFHKLKALSACIADVIEI